MGSANVNVDNPLPVTTIGKKHITYKSILTLKAIPRLIIVSLNIRWLLVAFIHLAVLGVRRKSFFFDYFGDAFGSSISRTLISPVAVQSGFTSKAPPTLVRSPLKTILVTGGVDSSCAGAAENKQSVNAVMDQILRVMEALPFKAYVELQSAQGTCVSERQC
jgi:hypothetical protein